MELDELEFLEGLNIKNFIKEIFNLYSKEQALNEIIKTFESEKEKTIFIKYLKESFLYLLENNNLTENLEHKIIEQFNILHFYNPKIRESINNSYIEILNKSLKKDIKLTENTVNIILNVVPFQSIPQESKKELLDNFKKSRLINIDSQYLRLSASISLNNEEILKNISFEEIKPIKTIKDLNNFYEINLRDKITYLNIQENIDKIYLKTKRLCLLSKNNEEKEKILKTIGDLFIKTKENNLSLKDIEQVNEFLNETLETIIKQREQRIATSPNI